MRLTVGVNDAILLGTDPDRREYVGDDLRDVLAQALENVGPRERVTWMHLERDVPRAPMAPEAPLPRLPATESGLPPAPRSTLPLQRTRPQRRHD